MRVTRGLAGAAALVAVLANHAAAQSVDRARPYDYQQQTEEAPAVDLWLDRLDFSFGDRIRPFFASERGAYVTIVRVTTDGEIKVLYPRRPSEQRPLATGYLVNDQVPNGSDPAFRLYESSGTGFVFAIASYDRFDFRYYSNGSQWSVARLASSRYGDPFAIVDNFIARTLRNQSGFSLDYMSYEVTGNSYGRSGYASRYRGYSRSDYYERCLSSFSLRSSYYCNSYGGYYDDRYGRYYDDYYGRIYGPVVIARPNSPSRPATPVTPRVGLRPRPRTPDPMVPDAPLPPAQGRFGDDDARREEAVMRTSARREEEIRRERPSIRDVSRGGDQPSSRVDGPRLIDREPRIEPRAQPRHEPPVQPRYDPPVQSRVEPRMESRPEPRSEPRNEPRHEPRVESRPPPAARVDPAPAPPPADPP